MGAVCFRDHLGVWQGPTGRVFQYQAGSGRVLKKGWVACGLELGRSVEIFDRVFPGTLFTLWYFRVYRVLIFGLPEMACIPKISGNSLYFRLPDTL